MRPLNSVERAWVHIGNRGSANAVRTFHIEGPLSEGLIQEVFAELLQIYPILTARIARHGVRYHFVQTGSSAAAWRQSPLGEKSAHQRDDSNATAQAALASVLRIETVPEVPTREDLVRRIHVMLNTPIDPRSSPLVQILVLLTGPKGRACQPHDQHVVFMNFHHAISDGSTKIALMKAFLNLADARMESPESFSSEIRRRKLMGDLTPSLTLRLPQRNLLRKTSGMVSFIGKRILKEATHHLWLQPVARSARERCSLAQFVWPRTLADGLREAARSHGVTLHCLFTSALLLCFRELRFSHLERTDLSCCSFINMRPFCRPAISEDAVGCYISAAFTFHHLTPRTSIVSLAKEISLQLEEARQNDVHQQVLLASTMAQTLLAVGRRTVASLSVSNTGRVDTELMSRSFKVTEAHVHSGLTGVGSVVSIGLTTTCNGLCLDMTWVEGICTHTEANWLEQACRELLQGFVQNAANRASHGECAPAGGPELPSRKTAIPKAQEQQFPELDCG